MRISDQRLQEPADGLVVGAQNLELGVVHGSPNIAPAASRGSLRTIVVHLTPYAPRCLHLQVDNPKRWRTFYARPAEAVVRATLARLERAAKDVRVRTDDPPIDDIDLIAAVDDLGDVPVATICSGVTAAEVTAILKRLAEQDWRPATLLKSAA